TICRIGTSGSIIESASTVVVTRVRERRIRAATRRTSLFMRGWSLRIILNQAVGVRAGRQDAIEEHGWCGPRARVRGRGRAPGTQRRRGTRRRGTQRRRGTRRRGDRTAAGPGRRRGQDGGGDRTAAGTGRRRGRDGGSRYSMTASSRFLSCCPYFRRYSTFRSISSTTAGPKSTPSSLPAALSPPALIALISTSLSPTA